MIKQKDSLASSLDSNFNKNKGLKNTFGNLNKNSHKDNNRLNDNKCSEENDRIQNDSNINLVQS